MTPASPRRYRAALAVKIAIITNRFPALSQTFVMDRVTGLLDRGHDVTVFARGEERTEVMHADVERYHLRARTRHYPRGLTGWGPVLRDGLDMLTRRPGLTWRTMVRSLRPSIAGSEALTLAPLGRALCTLPRGEFDAVLSFFGPNGTYAEELRAIGALSGRTYTIFLGYDLSARLRKRGAEGYRRLFEHGDHMLPICGYFRDKLLELGCPASKIDVHHLGVDTQQFVFKPRRLAPGEPIRLLSVARMVDKKGLEYALRAIAQLVSTHPALEYHIVGDGPLRAQLETLIAELGIGSHVQLHGWMSQEELRVFQERQHVFVAPSVTAANGDEEGTPVVLMEALAVGMPVVSTRHSGIPEVVEHGQSGLLVGERDADALAAALGELASHPERWAAMGARGRAHIEAEFNRETLDDALVARLTRVAAPGGSAN